MVKTSCSIYIVLVLLVFCVLFIETSKNLTYYNNYNNNTKSDLTKQIVDMNTNEIDNEPFDSFMFDENGTIINDQCDFTLCTV